MKATGITRKIDGLGRLVIPAELRNQRGWDHGTPVEIFVEGDQVILKSFDSNLEDEATRKLKALLGECECLADEETLLKAIKLLEKGLKE